MQRNDRRQLSLQLLARGGMAAVLLSASMHALCAGADSAACSPPSHVDTVEQDARAMLNGAAHLFSSPFHWDGAGWLTAGGVVAATGAATLLDMKTGALMDRNRTATNDGIQKIAVEYGDGFVIFGLAGSGYLVGLYCDQPWLRETALLTGSAVLFAGTVSTVTKVMVGRARPYAGLGNGKFRPFSLLDRYHAFPSGHTIAAFSVSTVLSDRIGNGWATAGLYGMATVSALSRSYSREHWLSDIVFAALYSSAMAHTLVRWYESGPIESSSLRVEPVVGGLAVEWDF